MPGLAPATTSKDLPDSSIRVVISPSQSSYFAGEPFSVTITFTNTRLPDAPSASNGNVTTPSSSRPNGYTHKRGAHSISSAPLARPPTSPGTPRSALNYAAPPLPTTPLGKSKGDEVVLPKRNGFIGRTNKLASAVETTPLPGSTSGGKNGDDLPELLEQRRRKQLAPKSLSVSISPMELEALADGGVISSAPYSQSGFFAHDGRPSSTAPHVSSPLAPPRGRSRTESVPSNHPHARKHSVLDGGQFTLDILSPTTSNPPAPYSPSSSSSTFSLALDPIVEGTYSPYPSTPAIGSPTIEQATLPPTPVGYYSHSYLQGQGQATPTATTAPSTPGPSPHPNSPYAYPPPRPQGHRGHSQSVSLTSSPNPNLNPRSLGLGHPSSQKGIGGGTHPYGNAPRSAFASTFAQQNQLPSTPPPQPPHSASLVSNHPYGQHHTRPSPQNMTTSTDHKRVPPRTAAQNNPNSELILYSYAQLTGSLVLTPVAGAQGTPEQIKRMASVRSALLSTNVVGGGSMDITRAVSSPGAGLGLGSSYGYGYGGGLGSPSLGSAPVAGSVSSPGGGAGVKSPPRMRSGHSRTSSFSAGLFAMLSPSSLLSSSSSPPSPPNPSSGSAERNSGGGGWGSPLIGSPAGGSLAKRRSTSSSSVVHSPKGGAVAAAAGSVVSPSLGSAGADMMGLNVNPEVPLPAFEVQPAMLGVDLALAPGESRSYTYTLRLPDVLPPTFKGKSLVFSYELVVGICRAASAGSVASNSVSKVMKVPIRVYNHVSVGRTLKPYDLLWPAHRRMDTTMPGNEAKVAEVSSKEVTERAKKGLMVGQTSGTSHLNGAVSTKGLPSAGSPSEANTLEALKEYASSLLGSFDPDSQRGDDGDRPFSGSRPPPPLALSRQQSENREREEEGGLTGCREAVEILTRNPKKASYDVNKDGVKVAILTFAKSAYRLGETVSGVVEINERTSRARVLKLTAILESHESLPSSIAPASASRHLRRAHAEHHASFTLNTLRTTFSLDIPSDASPAFQIRVGTPPLNSPSGSQPTPGGLEWRVRLCLLVSIAHETSYTSMQGVRFKSLLREGPRGDWGSSWHATPTLAPLERPDLKAQQKAKRANEAGSKSPSLMRSPVVASAKSWSQFFVSSLLYGTMDPSTEREYHDGDALDSDEDEGAGNVKGGGLFEDGYDGIIADPAGGVGTGVDYACGEEEGIWRESRLEMVECEVPVKIFPGNTAFKALDVVFTV